jgi:hypothetical protein
MHVHLLADARMLTHMLSVSRDDDLLGGMWAVVDTVFVHRYSYEESVGAALSRMGATSLSFALCFIYLLFFPVPLLGNGHADWGRGCRDVSTRPAGRPSHHRNHDCGRDGRGRHKPGSCLERAQPTDGGGWWTRLLESPLGCLARGSV